MGQFSVGVNSFRHIVEQLGRAPEPLDDVPGRIAAKPTKPGLKFVKTVSDSYVDALSAALKGQVTLPSVEYDDANSLLDILRPAEARPSLLLYVGHQVDSGLAKTPLPQLLARNGNAILRLEDISDERVDDGDWTSPRPLIFLLGCSTGTTRVDTGLGLSSALLNLGAAGVVATECTVFTNIVSRVARDLVALLVSDKTIGEAMHEAIWQLAKDGCPMGLVFTYMGPTEARLPK